MDAAAGFALACHETDLLSVGFPRSDADPESGVLLTIAADWAVAAAPIPAAGAGENSPIKGANGKIVRPTAVLRDPKPQEFGGFGPISRYDDSHG